MADNDPTTSALIGSIDRRLDLIEAEINNGTSGTGAFAVAADYNTTLPCPEGSTVIPFSFFNVAVRDEGDIAHLEANGDFATLVFDKAGDYLVTLIGEPATFAGGITGMRMSLDPQSIPGWPGDTVPLPWWKVGNPLGWMQDAMLMAIPESVVGGLIGISVLSVGGDGSIDYASVYIYAL